MSKFNRSRLKLLPAALGWLFFFVVAAFVMAMYIPGAHAADAASAVAPNALTCVPHKNFLGLHDGWDCTSTGSASLTIATPKGTPFHFWCGGPASDPAGCKGSGNEVVQSAAFGLVTQPSDFELAMKCHITPPALQAVCQVAVKSRVAK